MSQKLYNLKMVYHQRKDGTLVLIRNGGETMGFSNDEALDRCLKAVEQMATGLVVIRQEIVMVDDRFPIQVNPTSFVLS